MTRDTHYLEDTNSTHWYTVTCLYYNYGKVEYKVDAVDAFDAERRATNLFRRQFGFTPRETTARMTPRTTLLTDELDEQAARLLKAIEHIERECTCPAHQIAVDALKAHRARLVSHSAPTHLSALWENEKDNGA